MKIETYNREKYQILRIRDEKDDISDLSELRDLITGYVQRGRIHIAVSFCDASYIYSGAIRVLIECHKLITSHGGTLYIIEPDPGLFDILEVLSIDRAIGIYVSEDFLPS